MGGNEDEGARLFSVVHHDRTRGSRHKFKYMKFSQKIKKKKPKHFLTYLARVVNHWQRDCGDIPNLSQATYFS